MTEIRNRTSSYTITVTLHESWEVEEDQRWTVSRTPALTAKTDAYGRAEVHYDEKYEIRPTWTKKTREDNVFEQTVGDLDLAAVIKAVNKL